MSHEQRHVPTLLDEGLRRPGAHRAQTFVVSGRPGARLLASAATSPVLSRRLVESRPDGDRALGRPTLARPATG